MNVTCSCHFAVHLCMVKVLKSNKIIIMMKQPTLSLGLSREETLRDDPEQKSVCVAGKTKYIDRDFIHRLAKFEMFSDGRMCL